jgi:hypothetical protein
MAGEISIHQLLQSPVITKLVSQLAVRDSVMQRFFGLQIGSSSITRQSGRYVGWDIFNKTRTLAKGRAPNAGPSTVSRKPIGNVSTQCFRSHEKIHLFQDEVFRTRPLGTAIGNVDVRGQDYVRKQVDFLTQRFRNSREFMVSRIPRGGFGVELSGEDWFLVEKDDAGATFTVDYQVPAANQGDVDGLFDVDWSDPNAPIINHLLELERRSERLTGYPIRHHWINGTAFGYMLENIGLQNVGGSAYRIFDTMTKRETDIDKGGFPSTGFDVVFRALPLHTFHIYNGVLNVNTDDSTATADSSMIIPDGKMASFPEPSSEWIGGIEGSEIVAENVMDMGKEVFGFHNWSTRVIDPAGWEMKMVDNFIPTLYIPSAVYYPTIYAT